MTAYKDSISKFGLFIWMIKCQIGIALLSLPSVIQRSADGDSWISVLIAGCIIQLLLLVYWKLYTRFPHLILSEMTVKLFGRIAGKAVNVLSAILYVTIAGYASTLYIRLIKTWLLPLTPAPVILTLILATVVYLAMQSVRAIERFLVITSMLFIVIILFSLMAFTHEVDLSRIMPVGTAGAANIWTGSEKTFLSMLGFEVILYLFARVTSRKSNLLPTISAANLFVTLFYTYFVLLCLIGFSPKALELVREPVLFLFKGISLQLLDRLDLIFLSIWIFAMTTVFVGYLYMAGSSLSGGPKSYKRTVGIGGAVIFGIGYGLNSVERIELITVWIEKVYLGYIIGLPSFMLLVSLLFKKRLAEGTT
ncbi:GerAB/ArcD/ProY family transporter [Paenibacillus soyae]|uniref:Spore germination protein n=1 Tax=Paenibacillus soyae TaxID=2969249 RepID=A0A9X2MNU3_9BACL|nr:spore germination protein [Paenibacillus soyae]MCR2803492.1 spore germination protein [Paenibacillus soyae]